MQSRPARLTMNVDRISIPRTRCAYCEEILLPWRGGQLLGLCERCERPLALIPMVRRRHAFRLISGLDLARILLLPITAAVLLDGVIGFLGSKGVMAGIALCLLAYGSVDAWDGIAGLRTMIERTGRAISRGAKARRRSLWRVGFGAAGILVGASGLIVLI